MPFQPEIYALLFVFAVGITVVTTVQAWQIRNEPGGFGLIACLFGIAFWAGCVLIMTVVPGTELTIVFTKLRILGVNITIAGMFVATLGYTGYGEYITRRTVGLLAVWPLVLNLIVWFRSDLVWDSIAFDPTAGAGLSTTYGVVFGVHTSYSYLLVLITVVLLVRFMLTNRHLYQKQISVVLGGIAAPMITNIVYVTDVISTDVTVIGFVLTGLSLTWLLQREKFFDVKPIAHTRIVETLTSSVFVIDDKNRLVDCNQHAAELLNLSVNDIGKPVAETLEPLSADAKQFDQQAKTVSKRTYQTTIDGRHYDITTTPLADNRGHPVGRVLLVHDITREKTQQTRLQEQNERLDQFASIVSHDLRNPLNVAAGYLALARETGEERYFDEVEQSHKRMEDMIEELLTFARLDDAEIETTSVDLNSCAESAWAHVETNEATLVVDSETQIKANREYLLQLLENLFRNSVEHGSMSKQTQSDDTADNGDPTVTVALTETSTSDETKQLIVSDDGPGIPPDKRTEVLKEGYTTNAGGTGFGLSIVSQVADVHNWSTTVDESETGGAAFVFDGVKPSRPLSE
jgi:signal transduction histidine kinase